MICPLMWSQRGGYQAAKIGPRKIGRHPLKSQLEEIPGANSQGATLEEARENLQESIELVLAANRELSREAVGTARVIREPIKIAG